ncbi:hypothetical protein [Streptomyces sp. NBC_01233]|uniref:hypothetical protein n=1 Tax=Streptomyces sp. NBC_01233 TaxID=2903787 RepID=UPI002E12DB6C|nr:hypothetical protein OG332_38625 [Streptomyces sp. NBC_01233]
MAARPVALTRAVAVAHSVVRVDFVVLTSDGRAVRHTPDEGLGHHTEDLGHHIEAHGQHIEAHDHRVARGKAFWPTGQAPLITRTTHLQERHCPATSAAGSPC